MKKQNVAKNKTIKLVKEGKIILNKKVGKNMLIEAPENVEITIS